MLIMQKLISVALDVPINQLFDYISEDKNIRVGCRVKVPFGRTTRTGIILAVKKFNDPLIAIFYLTPTI